MNNKNFMWLKKARAAVLRIGLLLWCIAAFTHSENLYAQETMGLDEVITKAAQDVEARLNAGIKIAVLNFTSTAETFSDYVVEELSGALVTNRKVTVIERKSLDLIRKEMNLQLSGDVSDDSAQAIGRQLGAQAIVTGSLTNLGDTYRFRVKVINVETARIEVQYSYNLGNNQQVAFLLSGNAQQAPPVEGAPEQTTAAAEEPKTYKIGDTGPGGGIIFYDKGNNSGGWQYLEAAPADITKTQWQSSSTDISGTQDTIGSGKENTRLLIRGTVRAAMICEQYSLGGFQDWFLPSKGELDLMYINLKMIRNMGNFVDDWYWSSTQASRYNAWGQQFSGGAQDSYRGKDNTYSVRPIRQF